MSNMIFTVVMIGAAFSGLLLAYIVVGWKERECPRDILGYNCQGKDCDHSSQALQEAKRVRLPRHVKGEK